MKISNLSYLFGQGIKNMWRNRMMSVTAVGVLTICMIIVGAAELLSLNINAMVDFVQSENEMVVFLQDGISEEKAVKIGEVIKKHPNVGQVDFVSSKQAMEEQREAFGKDADLLDGLDENLLPAKYVLNVRNLEDFEQTAKEIGKIKGVMSVSAATDIAALLTDLGKMIRTFGYAMIAALTLIAVVIVVNTIKVTIFNRSKEINIMRYVGATATFIRIPFMVEGTVLGIVSAGFAFGCVALCYNSVIQFIIADRSGWLQSAFQNIIAFQDIALPLAAGFTVSGILIGVFGSLISIRKYARV